MCYDHMELDYGSIARGLPKAVIGGILIALLVLMFTGGARQSGAKQSYDFWTADALPFHITRQSQSDGDQFWMVELTSGENHSLDFYGVDVRGSNRTINWVLANSSSVFEPYQSKILLIPAPEQCTRGSNFTYSLNITYASHGETSKWMEVGKYPIFGKCG